MADYDEKHKAWSSVVVPFAVVTATPTPVKVDMLDYGALTFEMFVGAGGITFTGTNRIDFTMTESDDDNTYTAVQDYNLLLDPGATLPGNTGIVRSIIAAHASADTDPLPIVGYTGKKRYVKLNPVFGGTHSSGTLVGVIARKGFAYHAPTNPLSATIET